MKLKKLKYFGYKGGGCVPYLIANMTDSEKPIKGLTLDNNSSFDQHDASRMYNEAMDAKCYFKAILARERTIIASNNTAKVGVRSWVNYPEFAKCVSIASAVMAADGESVMVLLFETVAENKNLHAIGGFYDPKSHDIILIDPAKEKPVKIGIDLVFLRYRVMKVCPLFFEARKLVLYPMEEINFLFEKVVLGSVKMT